MNPYLVALDFDGTAAKTFTDSPHHITVSTAYLSAIEQLFGRQGLEIYIEEGEHRNRAPTEIIRSLLEQGCGNQSPFSSKELTEQLMQLKLASLLGEIGPQWPQPCEGFLNFWHVLENLRLYYGVSVRTAIISSGHETFIKKTFDAWGSFTTLSCYGRRYQAQEKSSRTGKTF